MIYGVSGQFYGGHGCPGAAVLPCGAFVVGPMAGSGALDAPLADGVIGFALSGHWRALWAVYPCSKVENPRFFDFEAPFELSSGSSEGFEGGTLVVLGISDGVLADYHHFGTLGGLLLG